MSREAYAVIFVRIGWFGVILALSVHLISQGNVLVISVPGLDNRMPNLSAFFAIPIIGIALAITTGAERCTRAFHDGRASRRCL